MTQLIEDYALIGDTQTAALVGKNGSIDWLCVPRFDSGAVFAALLGDRNNGRWQVAPAGGLQRVERRYLENTLVLETTFVTDDGVVKVTDCMPNRGRTVDIVRLVEGVSGRVPMHMDMTIRFDYGSIVPWVGRSDDDETLRAVAGPDAMVLRTPVRTHGAGKATIADFVVNAGEKVPFVLAYYASHEEPPRPVNAERGDQGDRELVAALGEAVHLRRWVEGRGDALAHHPQGADVRADRRDRRRADHVVARVDRQRPELGLPVLLAARRDADALVAHRRGLHRGGAGVARLAAARRSR